MKYLFILISIVLMFNSCTNRYERPSSMNYQKKNVVKKRVVRAKNRVKKTKKHYSTKSHKKRVKRLAKRVKLDKTLLAVDFLKNANINKNYFNLNSQIIFANLITKSKNRYVKKSISKKRAIKKVTTNKKRVKKTIKSKKVANNTKTKKRKLLLTATAYTSHKDQTDSTPFLAAWNNKIRPGMKIVAVSHDLIKKYGLKNGVKVKIKGLKGHYVVKDKMNKRYKKRIDIYMGLNKKRALRWGKRKVVLYY